MRATASHDTILEGAFVPDRYIARVVPAGFAGADLFVLAIFQWALTGFANIYYGLAQQLLDLTVESVKKKTSLGISRGSMAYHPEVQHGVAQMVMEVEAIGPYLDRLADDWTNGVDHGMAWPLKIVAAKHRAVESAWKVADTRARAGRRLRDLRGLGDRAPAPGRAPWPHPPGQSRSHPRDRRQADAGDQPGRAAALGVEGRRPEDGGRRSDSAEPPTAG